MRPSRREFVKWVTASGISLSLSRLGTAQEASFPARASLPGPQHWNPAANGAGRIDGVAKVTGAKLYASDFRAVDLPGWPATTSHAILVRAPAANHVYTGMGLARRNETFIKFGEETGPVVAADYGAFRFTRVAGATPESPDVYLPVQAGW